MNALDNVLHELHSSHTRRRAALAAHDPVAAAIIRLEQDMLLDDLAALLPQPRRPVEP